MITNDFENSRFSRDGIFKISERLIPEISEKFVVIFSNAIA